MIYDSINYYIVIKKSFSGYDTKSTGEKKKDGPYQKQEFCASKDTIL